MTTPSQGRDWFIGAIEANGSVRQCLQTLIGELDLKKSVVCSLINNLHSNDQSRTDDLTTLHNQCRQFQQTLSVRLSLLSPERETPWFRKSATHAVGPFTGSIFQDPVFFPYDLDHSTEVERSLVEAYEKSLLPPTAIWSKEGQKLFDRGDHCLWTRLLYYKKRFKSHCLLEIAPPPSSLSTKTPLFILNLENIDDSTPLPYVLESRPLRAFLLNIHNELRTIKGILDQNFHLLYESSGSFWAKQKNRPPKANFDPSYFFSKESNSFPSKPLGLLPRERDSLKFMGFNELPNAAELRKKYRELAKKLHPDVQQGQDHSFKKLVESYKILQKKISFDI